jgi:hypothetical protein
MKQGRIAAQRSPNTEFREIRTHGFICVTLAIPLGMIGYFYNRHMVHPVFSSSTLSSVETGLDTAVLDWRILKIGVLKAGRPNGEFVRIAGYAAPVWPDEESIHRFLLLPFLLDDPGESPPTSNQMILVENPSGESVVVGSDEPVWITGRIMVHKTANRYGGAEFSMTAARIQSYGTPD